MNQSQRLDLLYEQAIKTSPDDACAMKTIVLEIIKEMQRMSDDLDRAYQGTNA